MKPIFVMFSGQNIFNKIKGLKMMQENNPSYPYIAKLLKTYYKEDNTVVDAGCGQNEFKRAYNKKIIGFDLTLDYKSDFVANGEVLPIKNESVDIFLSNFVLEHVDNADAYLQELGRALKKDSKLILSVPTPLFYAAQLILPHMWHSAIKNPGTFAKAPIRFFTHGHPHKHSLFYEFFEWGNKNYGNAFAKAKLKIIKKKKTCNFFSLNRHLARIFGNITFPDFFNVQITYVLEKIQ